MYYGSGTEPVMSHCLLANSDANANG